MTTPLVNSENKGNVNKELIFIEIASNSIFSTTYFYFLLICIQLYHKKLIVSRVYTIAFNSFTF
jgi:hypothetical protein